MFKKCPATELTTADVLALVARCRFAPISELSRVVQMELMDTSPTALVATDQLYVGPNDLAKRLVVLDGDQSSIDVIDLYTSDDPNVQDPEIRVRLGAVEALG